MSESHQDDAGVNMEVAEQAIFESLLSDKEEWERRGSSPISYHMSPKRARQAAAGVAALITNYRRIQKRKWFHTWVSKKVPSLSLLFEFLCSLDKCQRW